MGRLVITHSTYVEGLIARLKVLAKDPDIQTVTPGVISRVRGHSSDLQLRVSIPVKGGFKVLARKGTSAQEVFVVTQLGKEELLKRIRTCSP